MMFSSFILPSSAMVATGINLFLCPTAFAAPSTNSKRDVWAPKLISPAAGDVLVGGSDYTIKWDTSNPPKQVTNYGGTIYLGHLSHESENLDIEHPLAQGFDLRDGSAKIVVPNVPPASNYIVVLLGDSGNASPTFTIE